MVREAVSNLSEGGPRWRSRGGRETFTTGKVCIVSGILVHLNLILHDRSLEDIGARSLTLSEKGKVARILDKAKDAQEVIGLVEKLRQAILVYQVSTRDYRCQK